MKNRKTRRMLEIEEKYGEDISQVLTELYEKLGTQAAVADELEVDISAVSRWQWRLGLSFGNQPVVKQIVSGDPANA